MFALRRYVQPSCNHADGARREACKKVDVTLRPRHPSDMAQRGIGAMVTLTAGILAFTLFQATGSSVLAQEVRATPGQLTIVDREGKTQGLCPLKGTKVEATITGFGAEVVVIQ